MGEVCSFKAKYVCSNARLEAMCYEPCWCLMHSISTWFASALVPPSHMRARPTSSSQNQSLLHFFSPPQTFAFLEWIQKREKNIVGLFAGAFQKTSADFIQLFMLLWFVLKMVQIILHHAVSVCTEKKKLKKMQR